MSSTSSTATAGETPAQIDKDRRNAVVLAACVGGVGAAALAAPFVVSFAPSERAKAAGAPVEFDVSGMAPGEMKTVEWRGVPVWVLRRTPEMLESIKKVNGEVADPKSQRTQYPTPEWAQNEYRSRKPEYLVAVGICTHLGCSPQGPFGSNQNSQLGADQGFLCPCHGSTFDLAGRVFKNKPAPDNLPIPPYKFVSDTVVLIGDDSAA
jgi:ubiquinol-cytochrome c reductase iron-sulfur subunit